MKKILLLLIVPLLMGVSCSNEQKKDSSSKVSLEGLPEAIVKAVNEQKLQAEYSGMPGDRMLLLKCKNGEQIFYNFSYAYGYGDSADTYFDELGNSLGRIIETDTGQRYPRGKVPEKKDAKCEAIPLQ